MLLKLKNDDRQVDIITLYKIAASSIPNLDLKDSALNYIKKCSSNPANIFWKCLIQPVIVLAVYYGLLRHGITLSSFISYQLSAMSSMRLTQMFVNIVSNKDRGLITYRFVAAILHGKLPSEAADIALKGFDPTTLFNSPYNKKKFSKFNDKKQEFRTRSFTSSNPLRVTDSASNSTQNKNNNSNSGRGYSSYTSSYYRSKNQTRKSGTNCFRCGVYVRFVDLNEHNRSRCKKIV